jgi:hypothetical protein
MSTTKKHRNPRSMNENRCPRNHLLPPKAHRPHAFRRVATVEHDTTNWSRRYALNRHAKASAGEMRRFREQQSRIRRGFDALPSFEASPRSRRSHLRERPRERNAPLADGGYDQILALVARKTPSKDSRPHRYCAPCGACGEAQTERPPVHWEGAAV